MCVCVCVCVCVCMRVCEPVFQVPFQISIQFRVQFQSVVGFRVSFFLGPVAGLGSEKNRFLWHLQHMLEQISEYKTRIILNI